MNVKRHHHTLPRLYLKGFVETKSQAFIWEYTKGKPFNPGHNPRRKSIGRPCATKDYYAYRHDTGDVDFDVIENLLEDFEKPANSVFEKIRSLQWITEEEKATFSFYVIQMHRRVPRYREELAGLLPEAAASLEPEVRRRFCLPDSKETTEFFNGIFERIKTPKYETRVHLDVLGNTRSSLLIDVLRAMKWRFFVAPPNHKFLTADDPVFYFQSLGLLRPNSEVSFPISTEVALVASNAEIVREGFFPAPSQVVKELNRRTASRAAHRAYFWQPEQWIVSLLEKKAHEFNSIH
jgi:hypothetical protein